MSTNIANCNKMVKYYSQLSTSIATISSIRRAMFDFLQWMFLLSSRIYDRSTARQWIRTHLSKETERPKYIIAVTISTTIRRRSLQYIRWRGYIPYEVVHKGSTGGDTWGDTGGVIGGVYPDTDLGRIATVWSSIGPKDWTASCWPLGNFHILVW